MILAAQEFLVLVQVLRDADFVAGRAEFRRPHERFQKRFLMELGFRLDQLLIDVLEQAIGAVGEWIMNRLIDGVIGVAFRGINVSDRVTCGASNTRLRRGVIDIIKIRIIKCAAEKRDDVMTTGAPPGRFDVAIALEGYLAGFSHAEQIRLVVKRAEMMRAMKPTLVSVLVTIQTVVIHHQRSRGNKVA